MVSYKSRLKLVYIGKNDINDIEDINVLQSNYKWKNFILILLIVCYKLFPFFLLSIIYN